VIVSEPPDFATTGFCPREELADVTIGVTRFLLAIVSNFERLKLGFTLSERTVSRYLRQHGRWPERRQSWVTFCETVGR
jgi:hypothetical protein